MSISQEVQERISAWKAGHIYDYQDFDFYDENPNAVIKAISRLVSTDKLKKISKGKFYVAKKGRLGLRKPSDDKLIRSFLYKNGRLRGYVTGLSLYNQLGLTTQIPARITLAYNGGRQEKNFGTVKIRTLISRAPITEENVTILQYLDVLKDIKKIPDADVNQTLSIMQRKIESLTIMDRNKLMKLARDYYSPQTRALVCLIFNNLDFSLIGDLATSLNPTTSYKLGFDQARWPNAINWNIK